MTARWRRTNTVISGYAVPGNEPYFVFAVPPGQKAAMRNMDYFGVAAFSARYRRRPDSAPAPHHRNAQRGIPLAASLQLVRIDAKAEATVWTFRADSSGRFESKTCRTGDIACRSRRSTAGLPEFARVFEVGDGREGPLWSGRPGEFRKH